MPAARPAIAWGLAAAGVAMAAAAAAFQVANRSIDAPPGLQPHLPADLLLTAALCAYLIVGALVASRRPGNPVGWLLLGEGLVWELGLLSAGYVGYAVYANPGSLPAPEVAAWILSWIWAVGLAGFPLLLGLFPSGLWPGRRWRVVGWLAVAALVLSAAAGALEPGPLEHVESLQNPFGVEGVDALGTLGGLLMSAALLGGLAAFAFRYRRASPTERAQLKWFAVAAAVVCAGFVTASALDAAGVPETVTSYFNTVPLVALPIAVGIALLRHRLYEIDTVIDRGLVAAGLAAFAAIVYVALVVGVGALIGSAVATAIVALALQPVLARLRRVSARLVYGAPPAGPEIAVRTLGGFAVLRHGEPLPASAWQSKKARTLLKILIARRGRPVPRDALMEALWPGEDPAKLSNRLSVALATLRSVLGPEVVLQMEGAVAVNLDAVAVDVEAFLADVEAGALAEAQRRYRGDFLEEDLYEDWAADTREAARAAYASALRGLARAAVERGDADEAVRAQLRLLELDRWDAEAHLALIETLEASGRHGEAMRRRRAYEAAMAEIGLPVADLKTTRTAVEHGSQLP